MCRLCVFLMFWGLLCLFDLFCFLSAEVKVFMFETGVVDPCCRLNQVFMSVLGSKEVGLRFLESDGSGPY